MQAIDQVRALYGYNEWANGHVLDAAAQISGDEFARELGASFGSVQGNLMHTLSAQNVWLSRWTPTPPPEMPRADRGVSIEALRQAYDASHAGLRAFVESLSDERLDRAFDYVDTEGNAQRARLGITMLHVANHGTHHRAETALLLTALGKAPRQLDYGFYELERAGGRPRLT